MTAPISRPDRMPAISTTETSRNERTEAIPALPATVSSSVWRSAMSPVIRAVTPWPAGSVRRVAMAFSTTDSDGRPRAKEALSSDG